MKFILVAPGTTCIPPKGWGAIESIIWDYYQELTAQGHQVVIVNRPNVDDIIEECNLHDGIVHIMYDDHISIVPKLTSKRIFYTSHMAYITKPDFVTIASTYYEYIFKKVIEYQSKITLYALSKEVEDVYKKHGFCGKSIVMRNGARTFRTTLSPQKGDRSLYVGKIESRKSQYKYQTIPCIDFVGNYQDSPFESPNHVGEWDKPTLYDSLTDYGNLILLSEAEADPLVVKEALMAGLGVVLSECSCANLDLSKEFITVIPNEKLNDLVYVSKHIEQNRQYSVQHRKDILEYAKHFSWSTIIKEYVSIPKKFVLVGPGILPIPPPGWGAVEILIWDYYQELTAQGYEVVIVNPLRTSPLDQQPNTIYSQVLIQEINSHKGDVVHIHYDCLHYIIPFLTCPCVCISSHYPYIGNTSQYGGYESIFHAICQNNTHFICAISKKDYDVFKAFAAYPEKVYYTPNGSSPLPTLDRPGLYLDKSIYVGKVEPRKKQHLYASIPNLDFYGKCDDPMFCKLPCYKGEMEHGALMLLLREYGSLVLLSDGEDDPLVIKEAWMAGLPIVTNHYSVTESLPFVDIIPEERLHDLTYVKEVIEKSRTKDRSGIREYASRYSWKTIVSDYVALLDKPTIVTSVYQDSYQHVYDFARKHQLKLIVYEKDKTETIHSDITRIGIPNIGRCDYSFLYYIVTHYHDLPNKILFTKANFKDQDIQLEHALNTKNFMLIGKHLKYGVFHKDVDTSSLPVHSDDIERLYEGHPDDIPSLFTVDFYNMVYEKPFVDYVVQFGHGPCFCVSKKLILQHPLSVYEKLLDTFHACHYTWEGHSEEEIDYAIGKRYHDRLHRFWLILFCPHYKNDLIETDFKNYVSL